MLSDDMRRQLRRARKAHEAARNERDRLIREAVAAGGSLREIGEEIGLTHTAVRNIAKGQGTAPSK